MNKEAYVVYPRDGRPAVWLLTRIENGRTKYLPMMVGGAWGCWCHVREGQALARGLELVDLQSILVIIR